MERASAADMMDAWVTRPPRALISEANGAAIAALASRFPASFISKLYFECHLAEGACRTDLIVGFEEEGRDILAGTNPVLRMAPAPPTNPRVWSEAEALSRLWAHPDKPLAGIFRGWLEFDLPSLAGEATLPSPGLFVDFEQHGPLASTIEALCKAWCLAPSLAAAAEPIRRQLASCIDALPANAYPCSIGLFPARAGDQIRLCIADLRAEDCVPFLRSAGWLGRMKPVQTWIDRLAKRSDGWPRADRIALHLDVGQRVGANLGIECRFDRRSQIAGSLRENRFLDTLVANDLCSREQRHGLETWPDAKHGFLPCTLWRSVIIRRVNHVKLCFAPGNEPVAKAYLSVHARPWKAPSPNALPPRNQMNRLDSRPTVNKTS